jgi:serine phosphatase RsbU (regulator of sigma subunit)
MSLLNISFLNEAINGKNIKEPNLIFDYVRQRLIENVSQEAHQDGMDGTLFCIDYSTHKITYASAYMAPLIIREKQIISLPTDKMPIGKGIKMEPFTLYNLDCEIGDTIYILTDGFADQFGGPKGKKFKHEQIRNLIKECSSVPLHEQVSMFNETFESWRGLLEQVDDVTCLGFKIK